MLLYLFLIVMKYVFAELTSIDNSFHYDFAAMKNELQEACPRKTTPE